MMPSPGQGHTPASELQHASTPYSVALLDRRIGETNSENMSRLTGVEDSVDALVLDARQSALGFAFIPRRSASLRESSRALG